ncbi:MAG TPA: response regulator, partial [Treponemataceae bacterium]|nr:response regulator [Treponemataceae bacterium]
MDKENTVIPNKRMLVIDDMEMNRDIMSKIFQFDFEIIEAENGLIAMDILHKQKTAIDIVILDLVMPEKDGYAVLKEMREDPVLKNIPVIVVSASGEVDGEFISLELGATDFLVKPVKPHIARLRVQNILARQETDRLLIQNAMMKQQHEEERILLNLITQSKNEYQQLVEYDQLTGIYNRQMFMAKTQEMLEKNRSVSYVLVRFDIEKFKVINELLGHQEGD